MKYVPDVLVFNHPVFLNAVLEFKDEIKDDGLGLEKVIVNIKLFPLFQKTKQLLHYFIELIVGHPLVLPLFQLSVEVDDS